jgi:hypothetical protein
MRPDQGGDDEGRGDDDAGTPRAGALDPAPPGPSAAMAG